MDIAELFENLHQSTSPESLMGFRKALDNIAPTGHPLAVRRAMEYLKDDHRPYIFFNVVCFCESFKPEIYIHQLFHVLPHLIQQAPLWAAVIHRRIFNHPEAYTVYKNRLRFLNDEKSTLLRAFLHDTDNTSPAYKQQCEALLYRLDQLKYDRLERSFDKDALVEEIVLACRNAFVSMHLSYYYAKDPVCGMGLIFDTDTLTVLPVINSKSHCLEASKNIDGMEAKWLPEHWACHGAKKDFFSRINEKLQFQYNKCVHQSMDDNAFLFIISELYIKALRQLCTKGFLYRDSIFVFRVKNQPLGHRHIEWAKELNSNENAKTFEGWQRCGEIAF